MEINFENMFAAIVVQAFITVHISFAILVPLSNMFGGTKSKRLFWNLFWIRVFLLIVGDMFVPETMMFVDIGFLFIGGFLLIPILSFSINSKTFGRENIKYNSSDSKISVYNDFLKMGFSDPKLLVNELMEFYKKLYFHLSNCDDYLIKNNCSAGVYNNFKKIINNSKNGFINKYEDIKLMGYKVIEAKKISGEIYITLHVELELFDYVVDNNGKVISGSKTEKTRCFKRISFSKKTGNKYIEKCPKCNAMIHEKGIGYCSYCGHQVDNGSGDWVLKSDALIDKL